MTDLVGSRVPGQRGQPRTSLRSRAPPHATQRLENLVPCPARPCTRPAAEVLCAAQFGLRRSRACQRATASVRADRLGATPASPGHWCDLGRGYSGPGPTWPGAGGENVSTQGLCPNRAGGQSRAIRVRPQWHTGRQSGVSTPTRVVSTPFAPAINGAPSESVPPWLTGRQYPKPGPRRRSARPDVRSTSGPTPPASSHPSTEREPLGAQRGQGHCETAPRRHWSSDPRPLPGPRPARRPPPRLRVRQEPIPTQARASATGGYVHWP